MCRESCFLSYTAECSHHLMAAIISKEALCQEENITSKTKARCHLNKENEAKKYIPCVWGKARERATQATPRVAPRFGVSSRGPKWVARMGCQSGGGGGGNSATFQITQQWSNISRCLFHMKTCIPCSLLIAVSKFAYLLSKCCKERKCGLSSEAETINRRQIWQPVSVNYTTFYRQHLCRGQCTKEQSRPQQHAWNSKLFVIFPAEITAAQSLNFQHLRWTEVMSSRRL